MFLAKIFTEYTTQNGQSTGMVFGTNHLHKEQWGYVVISWPILSISIINDPRLFRNAIFCYQKIRHKILHRLHCELIASPYAPPSFLGEQKTCRTYATTVYNYIYIYKYLIFKDLSEAEHLLLLAKDIFTCFHETLYLKLTYLYLVNIYFKYNKKKTKLFCLFI